MKWAKRIDIVDCSFTKMFLEGLVSNIANFSQSFLANTVKKEVVTSDNSGWFDTIFDEVNEVLS